MSHPVQWNVECKLNPYVISYLYLDLKKKKKKGSNIANENELKTTIENDIILPETV